MLANELKEYIISNDLVEKILISLECTFIKSLHNEWRCGLPNDIKGGRISIEKDTLSITIYKSEGEHIKGDIFTLCMDIKGISFYSANKYIHEVLGLDFNIKKDKEDKPKKKCPLGVFLNVKKRRFNAEIDENEILEEGIIKEYQQIPHISWIREGIMPPTCKEFNIGYSFDRQRIIIPERLWCGSPTDYIGIMGRTTIEEYEMLDIPKYFPIRKFKKSLNLYGLNENYEHIQKAGYVVVYEAQKSVLKRHSLMDKTGVSLGSHDMSDEQVSILISLNVDIVIALDKGININHIRSICDKFYGIRQVYYMYDKYNIIKGEKDSPADAENKIYDYLFKYKIKYNEKERKEYKKWREKQEKK